MTDTPPLDHAGRALLFTDARTASAFTDEAVPDEELQAIWELAKWAPTSANTQPLRVTYVQSPDARARLVSHMNDGNKAKTAAAPAVALLAADLDFHEHLPALSPARGAALQQRLAANDEARHQQARFNAALQAGYFILAVRASGLAAGPMGGFDKAGMDADFFPDGRYSSFVVVNIGHPAEGAWQDRLPRLAHDVTVAFA